MQMLPDLMKSRVSSQLHWNPIFQLFDYLSKKKSSRQLIDFVSLQKKNLFEECIRQNIKRRKVGASFQYS